MWQAAGMQRMPATIVLLLLLPMTQALGWGGTGHRITGYIAEPLLSEPARQQVRQLLGDESLAAATTYMDVQRQALAMRWPQSARWHYDNEPVCGTQPGYCAEGNCATQQLERWRTVLANHHANTADRALALRVVIHVLGDIHQPLHMADNQDRGGNNVWVRLYTGGELYKLHEVIDTVLIKQLMGKQRVSRYANDLRKRYSSNVSEWQLGIANDWAQQTHQLAVTFSYGLLPGFTCGSTSDQPLTLSPAYLQAAQQYLPEQLAKAGVRIAAVLNATFK